MITYAHQTIWSPGISRRLPNPRDNCFKDGIAKVKETPASLFLGKMSCFRVYHDKKKSQMVLKRHHTAQFKCCEGDNPDLEIPPLTCQSSNG